VSRISGISICSSRNVDLRSPDICSSPLYPVEVGTSEVITKKMELGLEQDLNCILQQLRSDWRYRKPELKPAKQLAAWSGAGDAGVLDHVCRQAERDRIRVAFWRFKDQVK